ncbi:unnamed protein product [Rhizoctonia solani]|uniref:UvrD-like helicase ATP-binding domain-containing protein n=1 Tax=Rhizoctonia solani TaxID=456999 RepID=A0A8H3DJF0_9AGAM|nr:unnamed protein product [Rhizoctonia solani]
MSKTALQAGNRWAVMVSARAAKELRKIERDQKALEIVHKKIRELSMGNFSDENHRPIIGTLQHVPMFRAKVPLDLRIIYQIDLQPDSTGNYDHQVIKIFQVESRARVDYHFWAKVSVRLRRTNPNYRERCSYRLTRNNAADDNQRPAMFPHELYGLGISNEESGFLLDGLTEEEQEQIQEITMDRFAPFNKALYNSIVADLEMVLPMVLDEHERAIVSHKGASIVIGRSGTGKTTALIYKIRAVDQENTVKEDQEPIRQMFVTRSRVLAQHVEATYQGLSEFTNIASKSEDELKEMAKQSREDPDRALVEFDTEVDLRNDLPPRYSELTQKNFPLFVSFDKLCSLLEGDIRRNVPGQINSEGVRSLISYEDFLHSYWPSFRGSTYGLEPNLVWSEIIGVIKGSQAAFNSKDGYLSRSEYVEGLSQRQFSLLAPARAKVYSIFELYTKRKTAQHDTDEADRTRIILQNLPKILEEPNIDYLYVDEVQDNLMIDIYLLRKLAKSTDNIYWSGDSAQTVIAGSSFRINDLKAFTYQDQLVATTPGSYRKPSSLPQFTTFDLSVNFRSLSGIVCFARSLVEVIHTLFPQTIDLMEPETAKEYGDPPIFFTNIRDETGYFENFLLGSRYCKQSGCIRGAQQAILVRDAAAAEELDARLQGLCNVLPIMDSKGLEFDDVLIYNFFSQSPAPIAAWEYLSGTTRWNQPPPPVLCSELKLLYVAVTRARRRCWVWDSGALVNQLQALWMKRGLVKTEPASKMVGQLATYSSKAQWSSKGREYFSHRLYKLAAACFRQAEQVNHAKLSTAYHLMSRAKLKRLRRDNPASQEELAAAATELIACAELPGIGDSKTVYFHAANCFQAAHKLLPAASAFTKAGRAADGIRILFELHDYKSAADLLANNKETIEADVFEELREQARVYLFEHREYKYIGLVFDTVDETVTYARLRQYRTQLKHILAGHRRYHELAEEFLVEKNLTDAVKFFVKAYEHHRTRPSIVRAADLAIAHTESVLLVEGTYRKNDQDLAKSLIENVRPFACCLGRESYLKIDLFYSYLCLDYVSIEMIQCWNRADMTHRSMHTLASYLAIKSNSWLKAECVEKLSEYLDALESYKADIVQIINTTRPCVSLFAQTVLGFTPIESPDPLHNTFQAVKSSLIAHHRVSKVATPVSGRDVDTIIHKELPKRLYSLLEYFHTTTLDSPLFQPMSLTPTPAERLSFWAPTVTSGKSRAAKLDALSKILGFLDVTGLGIGSHPSDYTFLGHQWLGRMFEIVHPVTGEVEQSDLDVISTHLRGWFARDWAQLCESDSSSAESITHALHHFLVRSSFQSRPSDQNIPWSTPIGAGFSYDFRTALVQPLQQLLSAQNSDRLHKAAGAVQFILDRDDRPDATVMIHFIETLIREIMLHMNPARQPEFDGLLLPLSWARSLASKYNGVYNGCDIECLGGLCSAIQQISIELRFGTPGRWLVSGKQITSGLVDLLNIRLCWCISFVIGHMGSHDKDLPLALETLRKISSDEMPSNSLCCNSTAAGSYHAFIGADDQQATLSALCRTFRHENLILMLEYSYRYHPAKFTTGVRTIACADPAKLIGRLSQVSSSPNLRISNQVFGLRLGHQNSDLDEDYSDGEHKSSVPCSPGYHSSSDDARDAVLEYWH